MCVCARMGVDMCLEVHEGGFSSLQVHLQFRKRFNCRSAGHD